MPSFQPDPTHLLEQRLENLDRLSVTYTEAIQAMSDGDVDGASRKVEGAGEILGQLQDLQATDQDSIEKGPDFERLRAKTKAVLDLHSRLLESMQTEQDQVARQQKELSQGRRHLESLQTQGVSGTILDSQG